MTTALDIPNLTTGRELEKRQKRHREEIKWSWKEVAGRLVEIRGVGAAAGLTFATHLLHRAQIAGEPVAWVSAQRSMFHPPDLARNGVDLDALAVVRVRGAQRAARAADELLRSSAFGLVVIDLGTDAWFPSPLQTRLVRLAEQHDAAIVCLTREERDARALGPMVSLRVEARMERDGEDRFRCSLTAVKDRRRGPHWSHAELYRGPPGLR